MIGFRSLFCVMVAFSIASGHSSSHAFQTEGLRVVALIGDSAPGITGAQFGIFNQVVDISGTGHVAFNGLVTGDAINSDNDSCVWAEDVNGDLYMVAREGSSAIGTAFDFGGFGFPMISTNGDVAIFASRSDSMTNETKRGFWSSVAGPLQLVATTDFQAPGLPSGINFRTMNVNRFAFNDLAQLVFHSSVQGSGVDSTNQVGIFSQGGGNGLRLVAREGDLAPGTPHTFQSIENSGFLSLNNNGQTAFHARLTGQDVTNLNTWGLWAETSNFSLRLVGRGGGPAPAFAGDVRYSFFGPPMINDAGDTTNLGAVVGDGITSDNDQVIWAEQNGSLRLVVQEGSDAPGTSGQFDGLTYPFLDNSGRCIFRGYLPGLQLGIWAEDDLGNLNLVALDGEQAHGTDPGVVFDGILAPVINPVGKIAFSSPLSGTGVDATNDKGLWAQNEFGILTLVVRKGDLVDVGISPNVDERTLTNFYFLNKKQSGAHHNGVSGFNAAGQLAFRADFNDGSHAIVVADVNNRVESSARSYSVANGTAARGSLEDLSESDNSDLSIRRSAVDVQSRVTVVLDTVSPAESVSVLELKLEGAVFARSTVIQSIDLFNYSTQEWEEIDVRNASRFTDSVSTVSPVGDLSRFIETGSKTVQSRIRFQSPVQRQRFTANIDQLQWAFE